MEKFFPKTVQPVHGGKQKPPQPFRQISQSPQHQEGGSAEEQEVEPSPQSHSHHQIEPHLPISGIDRIDKEGHHRQRPIEKIQGRPQPRQRDSAPDQTKSIIKEPQNKSQGYGSQKGQGLASD